MASSSAIVRSFSFLITIVLLLLIAGCAAQEMPYPPVQQDLAMLTKASATQLKEATAPGDRKVIYTGKLTLAVKSLEKTEQELNRLLAAAEGQLAEFREERAVGNRRAATWKIRIPPGKFHSFVEKVADLGTPELREVTGTDVTEEYIDIEARLKNKRQLEARILKLLEEKAGELKDIVAVEHELARVREEIERIEGRLRYLASQIELSTLSIYAVEKEDYQPPTAPTFADKVAAAWFTSLHEMRELAEGLTIAVVALAPWLVLFGLLLSCSWVMLIRVRRRLRGAVVMAEAIR